MKKTLLFVIIGLVLIFPQYVFAGLSEDCYPIIVCEDPGNDYYAGDCSTHIESLEGATPSCFSVHGGLTGDHEWRFSCTQGCYEYDPPNCTKQDVNLGSSASCCGEGQVSKYIGGNWVCANDEGGGGGLWSVADYEGVPYGIYYDGGQVGIGIDSPEALLHTVANAEPAFIAGSGSSSATGDYAVAIGYSVDASGDNSIAMGFTTQASGLNSTAMGNGTVASGIASTAINKNTVASGENSFAGGLGSDAIGYGSFAMGYNAQATGDYAVAMGSGGSLIGPIASGNNSVAIGYKAEASADNSTALGYNAQATGNSSTAIGYYTEATGSFSTAIGKNIIVSGGNSFGIGLSGSYEVTDESTLGIMGGDVLIKDTSPTLTINTDVNNTSSRLVLTEEYNPGEPLGFEMIYDGILNKLYFRSDDDGDGIFDTFSMGINRSNGYVGIGTAFPSEELDVYGTAEIDGNLVVTDGSHGDMNPASDDGDLYVEKDIMLGDDLYVGNSVVTSGSMWIHDPENIFAYGKIYNEDYDLMVETNFGSIVLRADGDSVNDVVRVDDDLAVEESLFIEEWGGDHWEIYSTNGDLVFEPENDFGDRFYFNDTNDQAYKDSGSTWSNYSDARLKDIKGDYEKGLNEILQLNPVLFRFKADNPKGLTTNEGYDIGFIAQEVQIPFPEAVDEDEDGYLDFDMHAVNVALVNAIKDQQKIIDDLVLRIEALENKQ
ncbi:tail fiber domain-containing protein [Patescibacteria group bacterium]|nr:tail fiber domain-containing protein [Patescibacteria group bacterium]MBU1683006.1 tail fiber domain-containing protein [Patescibacteria group bacterium]